MEMDERQAVELVDALAKQLAKEGKLIEGGWIAYRAVVMPVGAGETQIRETRKAFMAGAHYLFHTLMRIFDAGEVLTEEDIRKMSLIDKELRVFYAQMKSEYEMSRD